MAVAYFENAFMYGLQLSNGNVCITCDVVFIIKKIRTQNTERFFVLWAKPIVKDNKNLVNI